MDSTDPGSISTNAFVMPYDPLGDMGTRLHAQAARRISRRTLGRRIGTPKTTFLGKPIATMIAYGRELAAPATGLAGDMLPGMGDVDDADNGMLPGMGDDMLPGMGDLMEDSMLPGMGDDDGMLPGMGDDASVQPTARTPGKHRWRHGGNNITPALGVHRGIPVSVASPRVRSVSLRNGLGSRMTGRANARLPIAGGSMLPGLSQDDLADAEPALAALADEEFLYAQVDGMGDVTLPVVGAVSTAAAIGIAIAAYFIGKSLLKR